jgi:hypothetical protein
MQESTEGVFLGEGESGGQEARKEIVISALAEQNRRN